MALPERWIVISVNLRPCRSRVDRLILTPGEVAERNVMPHEVVSLFPEGIIINLHLLSSVSFSFEIYYTYGDHLELQTN